MSCCAQAVARWQAKLEAVEPDVSRVLSEEGEETALRKAEMEANKAQVRHVCPTPPSLSARWRAECRSFMLLASGRAVVAGCSFVQVCAAPCVLHPQGGLHSPSLYPVVCLQNMLELEAQIFSRPARTWFQTEKEKKAAAVVAAAAAAQGKTVLEMEADGEWCMWVDVHVHVG